MNLLVKVIIIPIFALGVFVVYALGTNFALNHLVAYSYPRTYTQMILESIFGALAAAVIFSFPISKIYENTAIIVSFLACSLVLHLRIPDVFNYWHKDNAIVIMGALEPIILVSFLIFGCMLSNLLIKSNVFKNV